jgi:hypothetical protein
VEPGPGNAAWDSLPSPLEEPDHRNYGPVLACPYTGPQNQSPHTGKESRSLLPLSAHRSRSSLPLLGHDSPVSAATTSLPPLSPCAPFLCWWPNVASWVPLTPLGSCSRGIHVGESLSVVPIFSRLSKAISPVIPSETRLDLR